MQADLIADAMKLEKQSNTTVIRKISIPIICCIVSWILFRWAFLVGYVPSTSMEPTIPQGSLIIGFRLFSELQTGDIIIFRRDGSLHVKRIAATEGDVIERASGQEFVPDRCYYLLGDNSADSYDSRYWEYPYVQESDILAKVISAG